MLSPSTLAPVFRAMCQVEPKREKAHVMYGCVVLAQLALVLVLKLGFYGVSESRYHGAEYKAHAAADAGPAAGPPALGL